MAFTGRKPHQRRSPGLHGQHNHPERATALSFIWSKHVILQFKFFNTEQQETALFQTEIDLNGLVAVAESKREMIREKGKSFAQSAVPFWASELVKAMEANDEQAMGRHAIQAAMAAWLADSVFDGATKADYESSYLEFNVHPTGMVVLNRHSMARYKAPKGAPSP